MSALYSSSFAGPRPSKAQVEAAVEAAVVALPALRDQRPEGFRNFQPLADALVVDARATSSRHIASISPVGASISRSISSSVKA